MALAAGFLQSSAGGCVSVFGVDAVAAFGGGAAGLGARREIGSAVAGAARNSVRSRPLASSGMMSSGGCSALTRRSYGAARRRLHTMKGAVDRTYWTFDYWFMTPTDSALGSMETNCSHETYLPASGSGSRARGLANPQIGRAHV